MDIAVTPPYLCLTRRNLSHESGRIHPKETGAITADRLAEIETMNIALCPSEGSAGGWYRENATVRLRTSVLKRPLHQLRDDVTFDLFYIFNERLQTRLTSTADERHHLVEGLLERAPFLRSGRRRQR